MFGARWVSVSKGSTPDSELNKCRRQTAFVTNVVFTLHKLMRRRRDVKCAGSEGGKFRVVLLSHPLLDEGVFVLQLPLLHGRVDDQLIQLHRAKRRQRWWDVWMRTMKHKRTDRQTQGLMFNADMNCSAAQYIILQTLYCGRHMTKIHLLYVCLQKTYMSLNDQKEEIVQRRNISLQKRYQG